jgi:hypothetical protein
MDRRYQADESVAARDKRRKRDESPRGHSPQQGGPESDFTRSRAGPRSSGGAHLTAASAVASCDGNDVLDRLARSLGDGYHGSWLPPSTIVPTLTSPNCCLGSSPRAEHRLQLAPHLSVPAAFLLHPSALLPPNRQQLMIPAIDATTLNLFLAGEPPHRMPTPHQWPAHLPPVPTFNSRVDSASGAATAALLSSGVDQLHFAELLLPRRISSPAPTLTRNQRLGAGVAASGALILAAPPAGHRAAAYCEFGGGAPSLPELRWGPGILDGTDARDPAGSGGSAVAAFIPTAVPEFAAFRMPPLTTWAGSTASLAAAPGSVRSGAGEARLPASPHVGGPASSESTCILPTERRRGNEGSDSEPSHEDAAAAALPDAPTTTNGPCRSIPMSCEADARSAARYQCLLREQIEYFEADDLALMAKAQGRNVPIKPLQVGIRCAHCARRKQGGSRDGDGDDPAFWNKRRGGSEMIRGAVYYPTTLSNLYQAVQNMANNHFVNRTCPCAPSTLIDEIVEARRTRPTRSGGHGKRYFCQSAERAGVIDDPDGSGLVFVKVGSTEGAAASSAARPL